MNSLARYCRHAARLVVGMLCAGLFLCGSPVLGGETSDSSALTWRVVDARSGLTVTLAPEHGAVPIGRHHNWIIRILDHQGDPVSNAPVQLAGGMRGHGHGMPSQPVVTAAPEAGIYRASGMLFNMHGQWQIVVGIRFNGADHAIEIPVYLDY